MQKLEDRFREAAEQNRVILSQLNRVQVSVYVIIHMYAAFSGLECIRVQYFFLNGIRKCKHSH